mmetsp:Transcript_9714/g.29053  ORF Transcript_9714/g.29053 Transcript_9714/m.29053 type:complete len:86 (+) Transcript_9714:2-259(+)
MAKATLIDDLDATDMPGDRRGSTSSTERREDAGERLGGVRECDVTDDAATLPSMLRPAGRPDADPSVLGPSGRPAWMRLIRSLEN